MIIIVLFFLSLLEAGIPAQAGAPSDNAALMHRLLKAYPGHLKSIDGNFIVWSDGTRMPFDDGVREKLFETMLNYPSLRDEFSMAYPPGNPQGEPAENFDPGRVRFEPFFAKMYGNCDRGEVENKLATVEWLPKHGGGRLRVTTVNGIHQKLRSISEELDRLPDDYMKYLIPPAGVYNCRNIAGTDRKSMHAYAAAIDINTKYANYWMSSRGSSAKYIYKNRIPYEIAAIFEKHGFIWGAKWYHFDTMHFEYRPEVLAPTGE